MAVTGTFFDFNLVLLKTWVMSQNIYLVTNLTFEQLEKTVRLLHIKTIRQNGTVVHQLYNPHLGRTSDVTYFAFFTKRLT